MPDIKPPVHPVQTTAYHHGSATCPQVVTLAAYEVYSHIWAPQPAMVIGGCRGGFAVGELLALLYARAFPKTEWAARFEEAINGMANL